MTIGAAKDAAIERAYQWQRPCWIVIDRLAAALVVFCGPHEEYLHGEPQRYIPLMVCYPEGNVESLIG